MSHLGKTLRMGRLFDKETNRTVIVAMDHGLFMGPVKGLQEPLKTVRKAVKGEADAIIISPGICQHVVEEVKGRTALILRLDVVTTLYGVGIHAPRLIVGLEEAVRMGADAVIAMGYIGTEKENKNLGNLGLISRECEKFGMPFIAEMIPVKGEKISDPFDSEVVGLAARVGAELGADIIKTHYTGSEESFRRVIKGCPIPIVIAGGPRMENEREVLGVVNGAINAGAIGVAFGRNIWQHDSPEEMIRAIRNIVHKRVFVQDARESSAGK